MAKELNPFVKASRLDNEFNKFEMAQMYSEFVCLGNFNFGKQVEYVNMYIHVSHLYNVATHLLKVIHTA